MIKTFIKNNNGFLFGGLASVELVEIVPKISAIFKVCATADTINQITVVQPKEGYGSIELKHGDNPCEATIIIQGSGKFTLTEKASFMAMVMMKKGVFSGAVADPSIVIDQLAHTSEETLMKQPWNTNTPEHS